jgi:hypothetical protein
VAVPARCYGPPAERPGLAGTDVGRTARFLCPDTDGKWELIWNLASFGLKAPTSGVDLEVANCEASKQDVPRLANLLRWLVRV